MKSEKTKLCKWCGLIKPLNEMGLDKKYKDGYEPRCKICRVLKEKPKYYYDVTLLNRLQKKIKNSTNTSIPKFKTSVEEQIKDRRLKRNIYHKTRKETDPIYKLRISIKRTIYNSLTNKKFEKNLTTTDILGCSISEFRTYIENKFELWMNWDNKGLYNGELNYGWDIDHIIPLSSAITEEDILKLNHYTNLQPLCSKYNRYIKRDN